MAEQRDMKQEINKINTYIKAIEAENNKLKAQLHEMHNMKNRAENRKPIQEDLHDQDYSKKIILYGLSENSWENEYELHERVVNIFHDILHVNLVGCIDDMKRLGRHGQRRPLMMELLSKQMKRYVLQNKHLFNNTGLTIHECLDKTSLELRKKQIQVMIKARNKGYHAIIRDQNLIINGQIYHEPYQGQDNNLTETLRETQEHDVNQSLQSCNATNGETSPKETKNAKPKSVTIKTRTQGLKGHTFRKRF